MSESLPKRKEPVRWRGHRGRIANKITVIRSLSGRVVEDDSDGVAAACEMGLMGIARWSRILVAMLAVWTAIRVAGPAVASGGEARLALEGQEALAERLSPFFRPPAKYGNDLGVYRSPLKFRDGSPVRNAGDWDRRRKEIQQTWHEIMGPWPPLVIKPRVEYLDEERRDGITQHHIRLEVAPGRMTDDAYLLLPDGNGPFPAVLVVFYDAKSGIGRGRPGLLDFALQLARRGFVTLSLGADPAASYPDKEKPQLQPLSFHAYMAANAYNALACLPQVDPQRIGVLGHSYGGKWAMFASCFFDKFACGVWSDPGIVFDESRPNVNYWEPWYLGWELGRTHKPGMPTAENPSTGAYRRLVEAGHDLHELHALMAPRPFLVSGGSEDPLERWKALNHAIAVNRLLGHTHRVAMTTRAGHAPTAESNEQIYLFLEQVLKSRSGVDARDRPRKR
jgi:hypothetical protein